MSTDPFATIRTNFTGRLDDTPPVSFSIQAAILIVFSSAIACLSFTSIVVRLFKKTGRFWTVAQNGIFHFNASMVVQLLSGIYAVFQVVSLAGYLTKQYSKVSHLTLQLLSPLILYFSLLVILHSLVLELSHNSLLRPFPGPPSSLTDVWELSHTLKLRQERRRSLKINVVSLLAILVLMIAPFTSTLAFINDWKNLKSIIEEAVVWAKSIEAAHSPLSSIRFGELNARMVDSERELVTTARLWGGFWLAMLTICLAIYLPAFAYVTSTLRSRRRAIRRALARLGNSNGQTDTITIDDDGASKAGTESTTLAEEKRQDIKERLLRTDRKIKQTHLRFFLTVPVVLSNFVLLAWVLKHFFPDSASLFTLTLWSAWSFSPLALLSSLLFAFHTLFARLPVLRPTSTFKIAKSPPRYRSHCRGGDSSSQLGLTSNFDTRSIASSTYTAHPPSSFHSRGTSFSNANLPSYDPISTYRAQTSYPPLQTARIPSSSLPLAKKTSNTTLARKAVPAQEGEVETIHQGEGQKKEEDDDDEAQSSQHGSLWKEELK
ncbi:uncharacterized protein JCM6883_004386 [Sporobolomyces salmoneus]|uniref:uncharacterized protein n=1 Tax=Sporobolomyces salmoneus TaxID=183962 RepID=UPI00316C435C